MMVMKIAIVTLTLIDDVELPQTPEDDLRGARAIYGRWMS